MKHLFAAIWPLTRYSLIKQSALVLGFLSASLFSPVNAQEKPAEIGKAIEIVKSVDLLSDGVQAKIGLGSKIRTEETVITGNQSTGQFEMVDKTTLAVGPNSELWLDKFVFNPNPTKREVSIVHFKGTIRFLTGKNPSETYTINTPTATIGVRGTKFDVYINDEGQTIVGLLEGNVNVCRSAAQAKRTSQSVECGRLQQPGRFIVVQEKGPLKRYDRLPRELLGKGGFPEAFPFLGGKFRLRGKMAARLNLRNSIRQRAGLAADRAQRKAQKPQKRKVRPNKRVPNKKRANNRRKPLKAVPIRVRPQQRVRPRPQYEPRPPHRPREKARVFPQIPIQIGIGIFPGKKRPDKGHPNSEYPRTGPSTGPSRTIVPRLRIRPTIRIRPKQRVKYKTQRTKQRRKKSKKQRRRERDALRR